MVDTGVGGAVEAVDDGGDVTTAMTIQRRLRLPLTIPMIAVHRMLQRQRLRLLQLQLRGTEMPVGDANVDAHDGVGDVDACAGDNSHCIHPWSRTVKRRPFRTFSLRQTWL